MFVAAHLAPMLPAAVLARLGLDGPGAPLVVSSHPLDLAPLVVVALLLALAEAFRQGEKLARDTEGLAGVTVVNLSVLEDDRARAVSSSTLTAVCDALGCQPGDLFSVEVETRPVQDRSRGRSPGPGPAGS